MAALVTAGMVGVVGVSVISPETAHAAGVVVEHRTYGVPSTSPTKDDEEA